jgi:proliferating cell nuclear antigen
MFECTLENGDLFRKIILALSDLVTEGNFMVDSSHISFQGMDSSHVSLCAMSLRQTGFSDYRCDRDITLGLNFQSLTKVLKCMSAKDSLSIRYEEDTDLVLLIFEDPKESRISNFELKLMDIDAEQLGIPDTEYGCTVKMPASEFQRICRDLSAIGDSVEIAVTKDGVMFGVAGNIGNGKMCLKGHMTRRRKKKKKAVVKAENDDDLDMNADADGDDNANPNENEEEEWESEEDTETNTGNIDDDEDAQVFIRMDEPVTQTFALRYLNNFTKATGLSKTVTLQLGAEVPLMCEYCIGDNGYIRYYLAPKIDDEE